MASDTAVIIDATPSTAATPTSAVSWAAIAAGTVTAIAATLILMALGSSLGFASLNPWTANAGKAGAFAVMTGVWIIVVQWLASALGGYLTGRLRSRWIGTHHHEVFFRDTAHGLITWSAATLIVAALTVWGSSAAGSGALKAGEAMAPSTAPAEAMYGYDADTIFRSATADSAVLATARSEAVGILAANPGGALGAADRDYLVSSAVARAGLAQPEAQARVDAAIAREKNAADQAKAAADTARKAAAALAIFTALSMLIGAFIACVAAALGGQQRDEHL